MRDIRVQVLLTPEEYLSLDHLADQDGESHSGLLRRLLRRYAREVTAAEVATLNTSVAPSDGPATASPAHIVRR